MPSTKRPSRRVGERRGVLGEQRRPAREHAGDPGAEAHPLRPGRRERERGEGVRPVRLRAPQVLEAGRLGTPDERLLRRQRHPGEGDRQAPARLRHGGQRYRVAPMSPQARRTETLQPDRNLALELVRVTEAAALSCATWIGMGRQGVGRPGGGGRHARRPAHASTWTASWSSARARRTRRRCSTTASGSATAARREVDIAVDPLEGTRLCALGMPNAIAVIALAERGTMFDPGPFVYMEKMAARGARSPTCSTSTARSARRSS